MEKIGQIRGILENFELGKKNNELKLDHRNREKESTIRDRILAEIISLINNKNIHILGPEKCITARFIAENHKEIMDIIIKCLNDKDIP